MTECRRADLREGRTQDARRVGCAGSDLEFGAIDTRDMPEFVNHSPLLRHDQQQQKAK
jgi:hypothetical protein